MKIILFLIMSIFWLENLFAQSESSTTASALDRQVVNIVNIIDQTTSKNITRQGIQWEENSSWEEIKTKALKDNKYIFLDCFTTWCGPCKMMDAQVYSNETVGNYFNQNFISVKVQMDRTKNDDEQVRRWYDAAKSISIQYHIEAYPTFVFLSPNGTVLDQQMGFKTVKEFISIAEQAVKPGRVYMNPYKEYEQLMATHKKGERNYDKYPLMINTAFKLGDTVYNELMKELSKYMATLKREDRYTKDRIEVWKDLIPASTTRIFSFFYEDGDMIDKVMNEKGYSEKVVDKTIQAEMVMSFYVEQNKNPKIVLSGMYMGGGSPQPIDYSEADWNKLERLILKKYGASFAKRNVLTAKLEWYARHNNLKQYVKYGILKLNKYPPDIKSREDGFMVNHYCWIAFLASTEKRLLEKYSKWMEKYVKKYPDPYYGWIDTYANLLYKCGRKEEAIFWEKRASELTQGKKFASIIEQMMRGEPTYVKEGAIWTSN
ncbi:thioredoxin family protein [Niastella caeni]|nr:thioredoxin family protein [Niastella caeni]